MQKADFHALVRDTSAWIVGAFGLLSLVLWVLPNWSMFWANVFQFPDLWQIKSNRMIIVYLCIKMLSPLIIMGIVALLIWMASFMQAERHPARQEDRPEQTVTPVAGSYVAQRHESTSQPMDKPASPESNLTLLQPQSADMDAGAPVISIHLLKDVTITIRMPDGTLTSVPLPMNVKRIQLLAYIAWRRGELTDRDKILEHVFGWGLSDEEATEEKLAERFDSNKKLLRRKVREVVTEQINRPAGRQIIDPEIDLFTNEAGFWGLSQLCRVDDLEELERHYQVIAMAKQEGKLASSIPDEVFEAAEHIIAAYSGDFMETIIKKFASEFRSSQGYASWAKKPYTLYRDYYLDALWYTAEYEWRMGQQEEPHKRQERFGRAAQAYQKYAMYACNSRFDAKAQTERVGMSERALRRCVVLLGANQSTDLINQVWSAYCTQMKKMFDSRWQPSQKTLADVEAAQSQSNVYRFAAQMREASDVREASDAFAENKEQAS